MTELIGRQFELTADLVERKGICKHYIHLIPLCVFWVAGTLMPLASSGERRMVLTETRTGSRVPEDHKLKT